MKTTKILSAFLVCAMIVFAMSVTAFADEVFSFDDFQDAILNGDGNITLGGDVEIPSSFVAMVGESGFETLQGAIDASQGRGVTLVAPITVAAGETLTIDLKGEKVSYSSDVMNEAMITNNGTLVINDTVGGGELVYTYTGEADTTFGKGNYTINNYGLLTINGGTVRNATAKMSHAYYTITNYTGAEVTVNGGEVICDTSRAIRLFTGSASDDITLNINDGIVSGTMAVFVQLANSDASVAPKVNVNITGGKLVGTDKTYNMAIYCYNYGNSPENVAINISGGEFPSDIALGGGVNKTAAESVNITGGEFTGYAVYSYSDDVQDIEISGGTFANLDYVEYYLAEGFEIVENEDGTYGVAEAANYVAEVDGTEFTSLADAIAAATNGDTVKLLSDIEIDTETYTIADGVSITLDMNGKKLTVTDKKSERNQAGNYELFYILGELTVTGNGTIELTSTTNRYWDAMAAIFHNRGGVLTIENGTFKNLGGTDMAWVVDNSGNWYGDATTYVKGGELYSTYTAIRNRMEQNSHGASGTAILEITGGSIDGDTSAIWAQAASTSTTSPATGVINISGGEVGMVNTARSAGAECITTVSGGTVAGFKVEAGELKITGGTVTGTLTVLDASGNAVESDGIISGGTFANDLSAYVADGFEIVENEDGTYGVQEETIEEEKFKSLLLAVTYSDTYTDTEGNDGAYKLHLFSAIDGLSYNEVGFDIYYNGQFMKNCPTNTVYRSVTTTLDGVPDTKVDPTKLLEETGKYIYGYTLYFGSDWNNLGIDCVPYYVKKDGTKVPGYTFHIADVYPEQ